MIRTRRSENPAPAPDHSQTPAPRRRPWLRALDLFLVLACAALVVYIGVLTYPVVSGYTLEKPTPRYEVRLQIVDASGRFGGLEQLARQIEEGSDLDLSVSVIETGRFDVRPVERSFVLSRLEDVTAAKILAGRLGLNQDDVEYKPLENNQQVITATLVVGADGVRPTFAARKTKEN